jgi:hypothetical protein
MVHRAAQVDPNKQLVALVREIFGNPFRWPLNDATMPEPGRDPQWRWLWLPLAFVPEWRTSTAVALAQQMYESRDFSTMPILADALQDAGCDNADILAHCRDENATHVRGCWVLDLVLGKR